MAASYYNGYRPIFRGQNSNDWVHDWKGTKGEYSNYSLMNGNQPLADMPYEDHVPGEGYHPSDTHMTRVFLGHEDNIQPLKDPGVGPRADGYRNNMLEYKGVFGVFKGDWGHEHNRGQDYELYSNWVYDGLPGHEPLVDPGHAPRLMGDPDAANSFGRFHPWDHNSRAVGEAPMEDPGQTLPEGFDNEYGHNRVHEWIGVPSAKAL